MFGRRRSETSKSPGLAADRLDRRAPPDVQVGVVDRDVAVEALARAGLGVGGRQALAAVVGGKDGADARRAAAEERAALDELDVVAHLRELGGGLRAGDAAADHEHRVDLPLAHELVGGRRRGTSATASTMRLALSVTAASSSPCTQEQPSRMSATLMVQAALHQAVEAPVGEVLRAAGEDERPVAAGLVAGSSSMSSSRRAWPSRLHQVALAQHLGLERRRTWPARRSRCWPSCRRTRRAGRRGLATRCRRRAAHAALLGRRRRCDRSLDPSTRQPASAACVGQTRAQVPQPRQSSSS